MRRFERYQVRRGDNLGDPDFWNLRLQDIDVRLGARENDAALIDAAIGAMLAVGMQRLNDTFAPLILEARTQLANFGVLFTAQSESEVTIGLGEKSWVLTEESGESFVFTDYAYVHAAEEETTGVIGRVVSYDKTTRLLTLEVVLVDGDGTFDAWIIGPAIKPDTAHATRTDNPHQTSAAQVGAYTVEQIDALLALISNSLALLAPMDSPAFTGQPTGPTPAYNDNSGRFATTAWTTQHVIARLVEFLVELIFPALSAFNNRAVNGGMDVSQEHGASGVVIPTGGTYSIYMLDQFLLLKNGTSVLAAHQVDSGVPGIPKSLRITVTTAQASMGSNVVQIRHPIEGYRFASAGWGAAGAQDVSIAFWIKAPVAGAYSVALYNSAFTASAAADVTVNAANTWELKTVKLTGVTTGTWLKTNGVGAWLIISIASSGGANAVGNTSYVTEITGVVVIPGVDLTALDHTTLAARLPLLMRPFDVELGVCRRYFQKSYNYGVAPGTNVGLGNNAIIGSDATNSFSAGWFPSLAFVPPMRAPPSMTFYNSAGTAGKASYFNGSSWINNGTARNPVIGENQFSVVLTQNDSAANALYGCDFKADARF